MKKQTIWEYPLEIQDVQTIRMPIGAEILTVQIQDDNLCLWAVVDADSKALTEPRFIQIYGTGHPMIGTSLDRKYIATFQIMKLVYHVFEYIVK